MHYLQAGLSKPVRQPDSADDEELDGSKFGNRSLSASIN
jgi:hypothetical protein